MPIAVKIIQTVRYFLAMLSIAKDLIKYYYHIIFNMASPETENNQQGWLERKVPVSWESFEPIRTKLSAYNPFVRAFEDTNPEFFNLPPVERTRRFHSPLLELLPEIKIKRQYLLLGAVVGAGILIYLLSAKNRQER